MCNAIFKTHQITKEIERFLYTLVGIDIKRDAHSICCIKDDIHKWLLFLLEDCINTDAWVSVYAMRQLPFKEPPTVF